MGKKHFITVAVAAVAITGIIALAPSGEHPEAAIVINTTMVETTVATPTTVTSTTTTVPDPIWFDDSEIWDLAVRATLQQTTTTTEHVHRDVENLPVEPEPQVAVEEAPVPPTTVPVEYTGIPQPPYEVANESFKECPQWLPLARQIGWPEDQLAKLSYMMWRESRCLPDVHYTQDPQGGSRGLTQINGYWCRPNQYNPIGYLQERGILQVCDDLYDPATNLRAALVIWNYGIERGTNPWSPWSL